MGQTAPGVAPQSPAGPGQPIAQAVAKAELHERARDVINVGLAYIMRHQANGASEHTLMLMRGLLRRIERRLTQHAALDALDTVPGVDVDPTTW